MVHNLRNIGIIVLLFLTVAVRAQSNCDPIPDPCQGNTYTQGAWGAGNSNPASQYLNSHLSSSFPNGLMIGCGNRRLLLTSPSAVAAFLPSGSTPAILPTGTLTNPGTSYSNVLAGQLVTLILNTTFDNNDPNFSPSTSSLSQYTIASGIFTGITVANLINIANNIIGGCSTGYTYSQVNAAIDDINNAYDNGQSTGFLICPPLCNMTVSALKGNILCFGGTTTVTISVNGGTAPYTGTGVFTVGAGTHTFIVTDVYGCQDSKIVTITQPSQLSASNSCGDIACFGGTTTIHVSASGGTAPYSGTGNFNVNAGVHSFTISDSKGCTVVSTKTVIQSSQLVVSASAGSIACYGGSTTVSVSASGGTAPYTGCGQFTRTAGIHSFTVTDNNGCKSVATVTITQPNVLNASSNCNNSFICFGSTTTVNIVASGGTIPYSGVGVFTVTAGNYSFQVTDSKGCTSVASGSINQSPAIIASISSTNGNCSNNNLGSASANVSGGTAPYTYTWSNSANTSSINNLAAGTYSLQIKDANTCSVTVTTSINSASCCNVTNGGSINGSTTSCGPVCNVVFGNANLPAGGLGATEYIWIKNSQPNYPNTGSNGWTAIPNSNSPTLSVGCVSVTTYFIRCARKVSCGGPFIGESNMVSVIINPTPIVSATCNTTSICFGGSTTVNISATGGTAPYTGVGTFTVGSGPYSFTVTDANGCSGSVSGNINQSPALTGTISSTNGSCNNNNLGSATVTASGGTSPYSYLWSNNNNSATVSSLTAGSYSLVVTDANACSISLSTNISTIACCNVTNGGSINGSTTSCGPVCNVVFGNTNLPAGGLGATEYIWIKNSQPNYPNTGSNGWTAIPNSNSPTLSVGCVSVTTYFIRCARKVSCGGPFIGESNMVSVIVNPIPTISVTPGIILCSGGTTTVSVSASGGFAPYIGTGTFTQNAGVYSYSISDANSCSNTASVNIPSPGPLTATANCSSNLISCNGGTVVVNIIASGGTAPYSNSGVHVVGAGPYSFTVADANGCTAVVTGTINQPTQLSASSSNGTILCNGGTTTVNVTANGGTSPYTGTGIFTVSAGTHSYTITDANGCTTTTSVNITEPTQLTTNASAGSILSFGGSTTVSITANGGTAPYAGTGTFTAAAGTHTYLVTDANGCSATATLTLTEPNQLLVSTNSGSILCHGGTTTVTISATAGVAPYSGIGTFTAAAGTHTYVISDANNTQVTVTVTISEPTQLTASSNNGTILCNGGTTTVNVTANGGTSPYTGIGIFTVSAGSYSYTVTDANGCSANITNISITEPTQLTASSNNGTILCNGGTTTVNVTANGGTAPYTGTGIFTVSAGTHSYTITDASGCTTTTSVNITEPTQLIASSNNGTILCNGGTTTVNVTANGGTSPYTGTGIFTVSAGTHSYTITDASGCATTTSVNITGPTQLTTNASAGSILSFGGSTTVSITANGGTAPYAGTGTFTAAAGTHTYLVTDANGCSATATLTLTEPNQLLVSTNSGSILCHGGTTTVTISATGGVAPYSGIGTFTAAAGTHTYVVSDANNTQITVTVTISEPTQLSASSNNGTILCNGGTTTININATGGTSPYTGTGIFTVSAGSYSYTVTDANGCSANITNISITEPTQLSASSNNGTILCNGGTTTVNVTANGGTSPYTGTGIFTVSAGTHSYTITDANGCTTTTSVNITEPTQLIASSNNGTILCNGGTTTVNVTANGGTSPYTGTGIFTVSAGSYSYTVTDANGCSANITNISIPEPTQLIASSNNGTILCNGGTTTVNVTANGGTSPYTGTGIFTVSAGTHSYSITDANGCTTTTSVNITEPTQLTASSNNGTILCNGGTTTVNVTATGGTSPYTGTGIFTVSAGTHSYTITDANGCTTTTSVNITEPTQLTTNASAGSILSFGGSTTVSITANGGTAPYTGIGTFTAAAGTHTYLVTDANGCSATATLTLTEPNQLLVSTNSGSILCHGGTTTVTISATGGVAPYSGIGTFTAAAGTHTYVVSDANNTQITVTVTISEPTQLTASSNNGTILCNGGTTTVNVTANGGTAPYTGTGIFTVSAGTHSYTITDASGCTTTTSVNITEPTQLSASSNNGTILCNGGTTTVNVTANGGTAPYTGTGIFTVSAGTHSYTITDASGCATTTSVNITGPTQLTTNASAGSILSFGGSTTVSITANGGTAPYTGIGTFTVSAGTHTYLVTDANGCSATATLTLTEPNQLLVSTNSGSILCHGGTTTVTISATGGVAPYSGIGTFTAAAGTHTYVVSDANNTQVTVTVTISEPTQLIASSNNGTILCNGGTTTVNVTATGGTSPYTGTGIFTVSAGTHSYSITDANGCTTTTSVYITEPTQLSANATAGAILSFGGSTTVSITANGGTAPYAGTGTFTAAAGTHTYLVTDANGCSATATLTLTEPNQLLVSTNSGSILCHGGTTTVTISATGGVAPYNGIGTFTAAAGTHTYVVSDANNTQVTVTVTITEPTQLTASSNNGTILCNGGTTTVNVTATGGTSPYTGTGIFTVSAGTHSYTITDANGCTTTTSVNITEPTQLSASSNNGTILCNGGTTTVNVTANGGTSPYTGTGIFTVSAGTHSYTITDANGCTTTTSVNITEPTQLIASSNNGTILCNGGTTTVNIIANGGTAPYTGIGIFTVSAGSYSYTVTDANGCSANITNISITEPTQLTASSNNGTILCNGGTTTVNVTANGGTAPYTGTGIFTVSAGTHSYTLTDANGCTTTTSVNITEPTQLSASSNNGTILCNGGTTTININATGGTSPYTGTGIFTVSAGTHSYTITDANGCTTTTSVNITEPTQLSASSNNGTILCNGGTTTVNVTANGGTSPYTGTGIFTVSAGTHSYTITDASGCTTTTSVNIPEPTQLSASSNNGTILCNGGTTTVNVTANGGTSPYTGTGIFTVSAGTHTYTITDANGCTTTTSVNITEPTQLSASSNNGTILCNGGTTTVNVTANGGTAPYTGTGIFTVSAGTHSYTITDANGCTTTTSVNIAQPNTLQISLLRDSIQCHGGVSNATISASGGQAPYSGIGTFTFNAGTYTQTIVDANGCIASTVISITEPSVLNSTITVNGSILCNGNATNLDVIAGGGIGPYQGEGNFRVPAGDYTFTVVDAMGCSYSSTLTITQPAPLTASFVSDSILCNGGLANATITAYGGTSPYNGTGIYSLPEGQYLYLITDNNGCSVNVSKTITEPKPLVANFIADTIKCYGYYTTIRVTAWGGTPPYTGITVDSVLAGTYNYSVSDANGCTSSTVITLTDPPPLVAGAVINNPILCYGGYALVTVYATGGSGIYLDTVYADMPCMNDSLRDMLAANGGTVPYWGPDTYPVPAGSYTYGVVDSHCCWDTAEIVIAQPPELVGVGLLSGPPCETGQTSVTLTASGGTGSYYGLGIYSVPAGTYTYLISDDNGCTDTINVFVDGSPCTGIEGYALNHYQYLNVYPNPNNGTFKISGISQGRATIISQSGQIIKEIEFIEDEEIVTNDLAEGLYFIVGTNWKAKLVILR